MYCETQFSQATSWSNRTEAQFLTDPSTGALWYLGGALPGNMETNEIDKYLNASWNTNIPTRVGDGSNALTAIDRFSSGSSHLLGTKIYLFGGFISGNNVPKSYRSFQSIPWIDISTATPTIGSMVSFLAHFLISSIVSRTREREREPLAPLVDRSF